MYKFVAGFIVECAPGRPLLPVNLVDGDGFLTNR